MAVTVPVTSAIEPMMWAKPRHVRVEDTFLVGDFERAPTYPLLVAAQEGRALKAFIEARSNEEACQFTEDWGLLYQWDEGGRTDRLPLDLFRLHQVYLTAIIKLGDAIQRHAEWDVGNALTNLGDASSRLFSRKHQRQLSLTLASTGVSWPPSRGTSARVPTTTHELGAPHKNVYLTGVKQRVGTVSHAAEVLASFLSVPMRLRAVKANRKWSFEDVPVVEDLETALLCAYRARYRTVRHFLCHACGKASIARRADQRFCDDKCSCRVRVQRFREEEKRQRLGRRRSRRAKDVWARE